MKKTMMLFAVLFLLLTGCSNDHEVIHKLDCVLHSVINTQTDQETVFKREDAIKNGYEYFFTVYDDNTLSVNNNEVYILDKNNSRKYFLQTKNNIDKNMFFVFSKLFDDVYFEIVNTNIKYTYECNQKKVVK